MQSDQQRQQHWNQVYASKGPEAVSWFQPAPAVSLRLIAAARAEGRASGVLAGVLAGVLDAGGGASTLVDHLLAAGEAPLAVLDISAAALTQARQRLGERARAVTWLEADLTAPLDIPGAPSGGYGVWHDRAVFHFLTASGERAQYRSNLERVLAPGGAAIIATFAPDGPRKCSGLDVVRYDAASIGAELGSAFELVEQVDETHLTPWNTPQQFSYFRFRRRA